MISDKEVGYIDTCHVHMVEGKENGRGRKMRRTHNRKMDKVALPFLTCYSRAYAV